MQPMSKSEYELMHRTENYNWWYSSKRDLVLGLAKKFAKGGSVLDVGCGTGRNLLEFSNSGFSVMGIDNSPHAISYSKKILGKNVVFGDITKKGFRSFNCAICLDVLEHIRDPKPAVRNIHASLREGGHAIISVPAHQFLFSEHDKVLGHYRRYSIGGLRELIEGSGLKVEQISYWNATLFPLIALVRIFKKRRSGGARINHTTELKPLPKPLNSLFKLIMLAENRLVVAGLGLPFGLSIVCVAKK